MRQPFVRFLVIAAGTECLFLQPLLNLLHALVWREMQGPMNIPRDLGEVQLHIWATHSRSHVLLGADDVHGRHEILRGHICYRVDERSK